MTEGRADPYSELELRCCEPGDRRAIDLANRQPPTANRTVIGWSGCMLAAAFEVFSAPPVEFRIAPLHRREVQRVVSAIDTL